ncbi:hypothetical protein ACI2OX_17680 [Bacillus sp. N9]
MVNVLGEHVAGVVNEIPHRPDWSVHFYGKAEAKQGRKMGHITILTDELDVTLQELDATQIWNG